MIAICICFLIRQLVQDFAGQPLPPYLAFFPAVMIASLLGGIWLGIPATFLTALLVDYFVLSPKANLKIDNAADLIGIILFLFVGIFISVIGELYRRLQFRLEEKVAQRTTELNLSNQQLLVSQQATQKLNIELEQRVNEKVAEIRHANETLQQKVDERTKDLQIANENLRQSRLAALNLMEDAVKAKALETQAKEQIRESQQRYLAIHDHSPFAIGLMRSSDGVITEVNNAWEEFFGVTRQEAVGKTAVELGIVGDLPAREKMYIEINEKGFVRDCEMAYKTRKGEIRIGNFNFDQIEIQGEKYNLGTVIDITDRRIAEEALKQSESRVRAKLESILMPDGEMKDLELADIIDVPELQEMMNNFYKLAGIPMAIIDLAGKVLVGIGWQEICTQFHRMHPQTCQFCIESDTQFTEQIPPGEFKLYKCKNNMWDMATPIIVAGNHLGNLFIGQFFFDDEPVDYEFFTQQAKKYGFDEQKYLAALQNAPRLSRSTVEFATHFFLSFANRISRLSYSNIKLARSLTQQKKAEDALIKSQTQYRDLVQNTNSVIIRWDKDGKISFFNEYAEKFFGYKQDEVIGKDVTILVPQQESTGRDLTGLVQDVVNNPQKYENNINENICKDGHRVWMTWTNKPVFDNEGKLTEVLAVGTDITALKNAQDDIRKSAERFEIMSQTAESLLQSKEPQNIIDSLCQKVMEHLNCDVFFNYLFDENKKTLHLNACAGIPDEMAKEIEWLELGSAVCGCVAREGNRIVAENIPETNDPRTDLVRSFGVKAYACNPILSQGKVIGTLSFGTKSRISFSQDDLSLMKSITDQVAVAIERIRAEEQLKQINDDLIRSNKDLEQFAYVASHDLQEPLRAVGGFIDLLKMKLGPALDEKNAKYMNFAVDGVLRMQSLIHDLLEYSRIGTHGKKLQLAETKKSLDRSLAHLEHLIRTSNAQITLDPLPVLRIDELQFTQLFQNLISNAIKFRGSQIPKIHISAERNNGNWQFSVKDNGIGIEPEYADRIFLIFQRLHTRDKYPGTGIGLAICKKIVERHGGKIWVKSEPGNGSTFFFTVPDAAYN